jgi:hypothetical protein
VGKKLILAIENSSKHEELVWSQEGGSAETLHQCGHRWEQFIARHDREYNPGVEGGHRHPREAVSEMIQHTFHIWGGWGVNFWNRLGNFAYLREKLSGADDG